MKGLIALLITLAMGNAAVAIPTPLDGPRSAGNDLRNAIPLSATRQDSDVNIGPAGALLERDYFQAPRSTNSGAFLCRLEPDVFTKVRLTQLCR